MDIPKIIYGSSSLGNLYGVLPDDTKRAIVDQWCQHVSEPVIDSAGKYGAGLALESIGRFLRDLKIDPARVRISNKLGWKRVPLVEDEPTFEKGAWFGLENDAEQAISHEGILECYHQGEELLGEYSAQLVSVHDPDEYLAAAESEEERDSRYKDVLEAYRALISLRDSGAVSSVGVGSKDWSVIKRLYDDGVALDWVMFANSFTILRHPIEVLEFMETLTKNGISIINSAVFNAGFLIGGKYFDYEVISEETHPELFDWRSRFFGLCEQFKVSPALACCQFGISPKGVEALALNTSKPERVVDNVALVEDSVPEAFWKAMKDEDLISKEYPYL